MTNMYCVLFITQKTAYELRIRDWSSDVCSSELREAPTIKYGCKADSDCAVKNVGNCCGAMPACVHKDSPVDPAAVQSQCAKDGRVGVCGFREIKSCSCNAGRCEPADALIRSEEHTSELKSLMRIRNSIYCLKTRL